jgi:hypothetical protein
MAGVVKRREGAGLGDGVDVKAGALFESDQIGVAMP